MEWTFEYAPRLLGLTGEDTEQIGKEQEFIIPEIRIAEGFNHKVFFDFNGQ